MSIKGFTYTAILYCVISALPALADTSGILIGDESDGSRSNFVHQIDLLDEESEKIFLDDEPLLPFSTRQTCGDCHSYDKIITGWHFNANRQTASPGRIGQAWIYVHRLTGTQLPVSYRSWPGAFRPEQAGLTPWKFAQVFGRQMTYPMGPTDESEPDFDARWMVSGEVEINCLACHDAERAHNQAEWALQTAKQNFRWAAAASCGFASVAGSAGDMPDMYDPFMPPVLDDARLIRPSVSYDRGRFDEKGGIFVDIATKIPVERCYFCHSNQDAGVEKWVSNEDVHLAAGLVCVDCHRNGLNHAIVRGYEGEEATSKNPLAEVLSCEGCHLPGDSYSVPTSGNSAAPEPAHAGIPTVHFDKLTCTTCHSGPWPKQKTIRTKTSRAHGLGTYNSNKSEDALPHIVYPVYIKQADGKIAPHKVVWPAFWGRLKDGAVTPIAPETVVSAAGEVLPQARQASLGGWRPLTDEQVVQILTSLSSYDSDKGAPLYICGGKMNRLGEAGRLIEQEHSGAGQYGWPIAHDVRPAQQSLGVRRCEDCHSTNAPFFFGQVEIDSPLQSHAGRVKSMADFEDIDAFYAKAFAFSFVFRPWLKLVTIACTTVVAAVLLLYAFRALACLAKVFDPQNNEPGQEY